MKNLLLSISLFIFSTNSIAQYTNIFPIEGRDWKRIAWAYYKDTNNVFNDYEGTWLYNGGGITYRIKLKKLTYSLLGSYHQDVLVGEYQFINNGVELVNTLSNINNTSNNQSDYKMWGSMIYTTPFWLNCTDCAPNEKRVHLGFGDLNSAITKLTASMTLKKTTVGGQEAIKAYIGYPGPMMFRDGDPIPVPTIPSGWYTFIKE